MARSSRLFIHAVLLGAWLLSVVGWGCGPSPAPPEEKPASVEAPEPDSTGKKKNPYEGLRAASLQLTPEKLGLDSTAHTADVYGVVMDWNVGTGIATLTSFRSGDASIYLSNGGGWVGGGEHPPVQAAVQDYLTLAEQMVKQAKPVVETSLPGRDEIYFYFLTEAGTLRGRTEMRAIEGGNSIWLSLFNKANVVVNEIQQLDSE